jgi:hypothetical protein
MRSIGAWILTGGRSPRLVEKISLCGSARSGEESSLPGQFFAAAVALRSEIIKIPILRCQAFRIMQSGVRHRGPFKLPCRSQHE